VCARARAKHRLYLCGDALLCLQRHKEALTYLDRVIEMRPNHIDALLARGEVYMDLGDDKRAMADFNEVRLRSLRSPVRASSC
jgi:tetratricopeptide (TPR) repeat protein